MLVDRTVDTRGGWANCLTGGSEGPLSHGREKINKSQDR